MKIIIEGVIIKSQKEIEELEKFHNKLQKSLLRLNKKTENDSIRVIYQKNEFRNIIFDKNNEFHKIIVNDSFINIQNN